MYVFHKSLCFIPTLTKLMCSPSPAKHSRSHGYTSLWFVRSVCVHMPIKLIHVSALDVPEILIAVLEDCPLSTLAGCCRVSRHWNILAVDVLWRRAPLKALTGAPPGHHHGVGTALLFCSRLPYANHIIGRDCIPRPLGPIHGSSWSRAHACV